MSRLPTGARPLRRLLNPRSIAVAGGSVAAEVIRQCRLLGYAGQIWPVNPHRAEIEGIPTVAHIDALPGVPDAAYIAVNREQTIAMVASLSRRGAGGAVCYASGFAELDAEGAQLQDRLVEAAGDMALLGPNCYGLVNYLEGCALWPDLQGGERVARGVAILTQSGNIALNLTMQRRHLPIACVVAVGNQAVSAIHDCIEALIEDPRISAIGLHLEGLEDIPAFAAAAQAARARGIPMVAIKAGASALGARLTASHTSALAGPDVLYSALFARLGIARCADLDEFIETLKLLHVCGPLAGRRVASLSCSGGDAALVADLGEPCGLTFPALPAEVSGALAGILGPRVPIHNPLDYQTYIWGDVARLEACFHAMMGAQVDVTLVVLDFPHPGEAPAPGWDEVAEGFIAAHLRRGRPAILVSSLAELLPDRVARRLLAVGIAPLQGLRNCARAIAAAASIGERWHSLARRPLLPLAPPLPLCRGVDVLLEEAAAKSALAAYGLPVPAGRRVDDAAQAVAAAAALGYPVALKAAGTPLAHKTEAGAVILGLSGPEALRAAAEQLAGRFPALLVERMAQGGLLELIVGVTRDPHFGLALTVGAGGVWVELLGDSATLLLPVARADIESALRGLRCFPLLDGRRGRPHADLDGLLDAIQAIVGFAEAHAGALLELDVNPLIALPQGAMAVDALVRLVESGADSAAAPAAPASGQPAA